MSLNPVVAYISRSALRHNLTRVQTFAKSAKVLAMVKANGYGHDAVEVAKTLINIENPVDAFGVARINEALVLRQANIQVPIVLMEGCFNKEELLCASEQQFEIVLHNKEQLQHLLSTTLPKPLRVWLKLDTGMGRVGFNQVELSEAINQLKGNANVIEPFTCMTHFACADQLNDERSRQQLAKFNSVVEANQPLLSYSCANSAAIIANPNAHFEWVRPGIMLFGSSPIQDTVCSDYDLQPVMSLRSIVIAVRNVKAGETVGYGARWTAQKDTQVAVVAMGYGDGYPRNAKDGTPVMINGVIYPLAGRVSMDMITVDVGLNSEIKMGDPVTLWGIDELSGEVLPAERVAGYADTISYEMFCNLAARVEKRFID
ncbi:MAG: alanine racemase [Gammaproteobacteria bacterium]|nr:alanine racemase [Gammaproteobacteria bacterium]